MTKTNDFIGNIILLVLIFGAGIQFIVLNWRVMEKNLPNRNILTLIATIVCCLCLMLPFLGPLIPFSARIVLIAVFSPVAGWLAYRMDDEPVTSISLALACLVSVVFVSWGLIKLGFIPSSSSWIFFNMPILLVLVVGVLISRKHSTMRTFMLVSVGGYLFEYML